MAPPPPHLLTNQAENERAEAAGDDGDGDGDATRRHELEPRGRPSKTNCLVSNNWPNGPQRARMHACMHALALSVRAQHGRPEEAMDGWMDLASRTHSARQ